MKTNKKTTVRLYTRGGDFGTTGLIGGMRRRKDDQIFEVLGTIDELNAWFGMVLAGEKKQEKNKKKQTKDVPAAFQTDIWFIQDRLLRMGAMVAGSTRVRITARDVSWLERRIDFFQTELGDAWLTSFVLPGGVAVAARLDVARAVCRRLERRLVSFQEHPKCEIRNVKSILQFVNRLSDYVFALRCYVNATLGYEEQKFTG